MTYLCLTPCGPHDSPNDAFCGLDLGHKGKHDPAGLPTRTDRTTQPPSFSY